jgi:hypothetical protein
VEDIIAFCVFLMAYQRVCLYLKGTGNLLAACLSGYLLFDGSSWQAKVLAVCYRAWRKEVLVYSIFDQRTLRVSLGVWRGVGGGLEGRCQVR